MASILPKAWGLPMAVAGLVSEAGSSPGAAWNDVRPRAGDGGTRLLKHHCGRSMARGRREKGDCDQLLFSSLGREGVLRV